MWMTRWTTALIVGIAACAGNKPDSVAPRADLFGTWQLDPAASDSAGPLTGADADGRRPSGGPGGMGGGRRIPRRGGRPEVLGGGMEEAAELRRIVETWTRSNERLRIAGADGVVKLEYGDVATLQIVANGKALKHAFRGHDRVVSKAKWKAGRLEITHQVGRVRIIETYARAPASPRLTVTTVGKGGTPQPVEFLRIYDLN